MNAFRLTLLLITLLTFYVIPANGKDNSGSISVQGNATLIEKAEFSKINGQLKVVSDSIQGSYNQITEQLVNIAGKLKSHGISKEDIVVSMINQGADYEWRNNSRKLRGYFSSCSLKIKVKDIEKTYTIHEELAKFQDLSIGHTEYDRSDREQLYLKALDRALLSAKDKARSMAKTLNAEIGGVLHINEGVNMPQPVMRAKAMYAEMDSTAPGQVTTTGAITVQASVMVEFKLK